MEGEARRQHWHVEGAPVVGHQAIGCRQVGGQGAQQRSLERVVGEQVLAHDHRVAAHPCHAGQEDDRARAGRQAGRFGVEVGRRRTLCHRAADARPAAAAAAPPPMRDRPRPRGCGRRTSGPAAPTGPRARPPAVRRAAGRRPADRPANGAATAGSAIEGGEQLDHDLLAPPPDLDRRSDAGRAAIGARAGLDRLAGGPDQLGRRACRGARSGRRRRASRRRGRASAGR